MEQSTYAGWTLASGHDREGELTASRDDEEDDNTPTTSQTIDVFPVPRDPMQKMGAGMYTDAAEEDTTAGGIEAVRDAVDDRIACSRLIWTCRWG
jgi:hypothetical protein